MMLNGLRYVYDKVQNLSRPTLYPGESTDNWEIPEEYSSVFAKLNSILENKYNTEYLKVCAFYNKMFPSLKFNDWGQVSYNASPFTWLDQERSDYGTGMSNNFLKQIIDQVTSRLGTIAFVPYLLSEDQNFEYIIYKDEVERILRMYITKDNFNRKCIDVFHDSAILGYSHVLLDPYTGNLIKANDYEIGLFESQMTKGKVTQALYRDYAFPVTEVKHYIEDLDYDARKEVLDNIKDRVTVDFCLFFDCGSKKCVCSIDGKFLPAKDYPFNKVLIATMRWDTGFTAVTSTSLFDLLYPMQREINKINAKIQQLIRNYKGATPVFNADVELAMKSITNGAGECLYVDSQRPLDSLMTVINPTPLDPELTGVIQEYKATMYELAGIQNASFDMENMRSAAAVVALDQTRDSVFQAQLAGLADFIAESLKLYIYYNAGYKLNDDNMDWDSIKDLIDTAYISLKPVHVNDPLSDEDKSRGETIDYMQLCTARCVLKVIKGEMTFNALPYFIDWEQVVLMLCATIVKFEALGIEIPDSVHEFLIAAFVEDIKVGNTEL